MGFWPGFTFSLFLVRIELKDMVTDQFRQKKLHVEFRPENKTEISSKIRTNRAKIGAKLNKNQILDQNPNLKPTHLHRSFYAMARCRKSRTGGGQAV